MAGLSRDAYDVLFQAAWELAPRPMSLANATIWNKDGHWLRMERANGFATDRMIYFICRWAHEPPQDDWRPDFYTITVRLLILGDKPGSIIRTMIDSLAQAFEVFDQHCVLMPFGESNIFPEPYNA